MNSRTFKTIATASLFGLAMAAAPAFANNEKQKPEDPANTTAQEQDTYTTPTTGAAAAASASTFADLDINSDGFVTRDEVSTDTVLTQRFAALDKNSDGKLSQTECTDAAGGGCYQ